MELSPLMSSRRSPRIPLHPSGQQLLRSLHKIETQQAPRRSCVRRGTRGEIRAAAATAIAMRSGPALSEAMVPMPGDHNEIVRFTATAALVWLSKVPGAGERSHAARSDQRLGGHMNAQDAMRRLSGTFINEGQDRYRLACGKAVLLVRLLGVLNADSLCRPGPRRLSSRCRELHRRGSDDPRGP